MSTLKFDARAADALVKAYAAPDLVAQRETVLRLLNLQPGERAIDVGSGPGFLCESMAEQVGAQGHVQGIDISADLVAFCRDRNPPSHLKYTQENALAPSAPDDSFDVAVCTQVAEYIPDTDTLLSQLFRILRPGGRLLVMATDWDSVTCYTENLQRMQGILAAWESHCAHPRLPRVLARKMTDHGFSNISATMHPIINLNFAKQTYSFAIFRLMRAFVVGAGFSEEEVNACLNEMTRLDETGQFYFAMSRLIFSARKPD